VRVSTLPGTAFGFQAEQAGCKGYKREITDGLEINIILAWQKFSIFYDKRGEILQFIPENSTY
jgi:hypothetical protein